MRVIKVIEDQDDKDMQTSFVNLNDDLDRAIKTEKNDENECGDLGEKLQNHNDELDLTNETQPLDENDNCELGEKMLNEEEDELINQQSSNSPGKLTKKSIKPKKKKKKPKTPEELERDKLLAINEK